MPRNPPPHSERPIDCFHWDFVTVGLLVLIVFLVAYFTSEMWLPHWGTE